MKSTHLNRIFFYSDPHFGHQNVLKFCNRPFETVGEMDMHLIEKYNAKVTDQDIVVWLGDCFFSSSGYAKNIMRSLNGTKILVRGNHDQSAGRMMSLGFSFVCDAMWLVIAGQKVFLKHYPYRPPWWTMLLKPSLKKKIKYFDRRPKDEGHFLIHGHTHSTEKFKDRMINVGVDAWSFTPVPYGEVEKRISRYCSKNNILP